MTQIIGKMDLGISERVAELRDKVRTIMEEDVIRYCQVI